jgi:uncharacterized protein
MERLDIVGDSSPYLNVNKKEKNKSRKAKGKKVFSGTLAGAREHDEEQQLRSIFGISEGRQVDLEEALDDIHEIGEELKDNPKLSLVKDYRRAVGVFVRYVVKNGFSLEKHKLRGFKVLKIPKGQQPELTVIRIVDKKLDELARQILENQKDQLEILRRIDEIYGILVDITT